jgi:hypothetical protein
MAELYDDWRPPEVKALDARAADLSEIALDVLAGVRRPLLQFRRRGGMYTGQHVVRQGQYTIFTVDRHDTVINGEELSVLDVTVRRRSPELTGTPLGDTLESVRMTNRGHVAVQPVTGVVYTDVQLMDPVVVFSALDDLRKVAMQHVGPVNY